MRTTLNLNDALMRKAKKTAAQSGRTITALIETALRNYLYSDARPQAPPAPLPTSTCRGGMQPGVRMNSSSEILHELDAEDAHF